MKTLLIENSSATGSLAVGNEEGDIIERLQFQQAGELAVQVKTLYERYHRFDELVVGIGPGSYTGLRVATSLAIGLKISGRCAAYGCLSLFGFPEENYVVIGDARRETFFVSVVEKSGLAMSPQLIAVEHLAATLMKWNAYPIFSVTSFPDFVRAELRVPVAEYLIRHRSQFEPLNEPLYLKPPHVTYPAKVQKS